jgi:DNA-binding XRE family transcriptional regulator
MFDMAYSRSDTGYATFGGLRARYKSSSVCRYICEALNGPPPTAKHQAAHNCGKGHLGCVNGSHLRWDTPKGNAADMIIHGAVQRGERSVNSKLKEQQVIQIRSMQNIHTQAQLAALFGVTSVTINQIINNKRWKHIPTPSVMLKGQDLFA